MSSCGEPARRREPPEQVVAERLGVAVEALGGRAQALQALVDRLAPALDQPVRVEHDDVARPQARPRRPRRPRAAPAAASTRRRAGSARSRRRRAAAAAGAPRCRRSTPPEVGRDVHQHHGRHLERAQREPVEPDQRVHRPAALDRVRAQPRAQLAHQRRGAQALAGHVADHDRQLARGQRQCVVPVAADLDARARQEARRQLEPVDRGQRRAAAGCAAASRRSGARARRPARARSPAPRARRPARAGRGRPRRSGPARPRRRAGRR